MLGTGLPFSCPLPSHDPRSGIPSWPSAASREFLEAKRKADLLGAGRASSLPPDHPPQELASSPLPQAAGRLVWQVQLHCWLTSTPAAQTQAQPPRVCPSTCCAPSLAASPRRGGETPASARTPPPGACAGPRAAICIPPTSQPTCPSSRPGEGVAVALGRGWMRASRLASKTDLLLGAGAASLFRRGRVRFALGSSFAPGCALAAEADVPTAPSPGSVTWPRGDAKLGSQSCSAWRNL